MQPAGLPSMKRVIRSSAACHAECLRGPEIDHEVKFRGLLDRQVGWLLAFENAASVVAGQRVRIGDARSVTHQAAGRGELAQRIGRR